MSIIEPFSRYDGESVELYSLRGWVDKSVRMLAGLCSDGIEAIQPDTALVVNILAPEFYI
jgi:hypothetical protein